MILNKIRFIYHYIKAFLYYTLKYKSRLKLARIKVANNDETISYLLDHDVSISRYGDGEFQLVWQYLTGEEYLDKDTFQKYDEKLAQRLSEILSSKKYNNKKHIVCVSYIFYRDDKGKGGPAKIFRMNFIANHSKLLFNSLNSNRQYYDANITRFYLSETDKHKSLDRINAIRSIWNDKDICFIEGEKSRLGVGNDLFSNARSIRRILCPSESAFDFYDEILEEAKSQPKDTLFLLALGMTATVLAYDLSNNGFRALDLGHIDIEYEWMLMGATKKVAIPGKYTNEASGGKTVNKLKDEYIEKYNSEIVGRIGC